MLSVSAADSDVRYLRREPSTSGSEDLGYSDVDVTDAPLENLAAEQVLNIGKRAEHPKPDRGSWRLVSSTPKKLQSQSSFELANAPSIDETVKHEPELDEPKSVETKQIEEQAKQIEEQTKQIEEQTKQIEEQTKRIDELEAQLDEAHKDLESAKQDSKKLEAKSTNLQAATAELDSSLQAWKSKYGKLLGDESKRLDLGEQANAVDKLSYIEATNYLKNVLSKFGVPLARLRDYVNFVDADLFDFLSELHEILHGVPIKEKQRAMTAMDTEAFTSSLDKMLEEVRQLQV